MICSVQKILSLLHPIFFFFLAFNEDFTEEEVEFQNLLCMLLHHLHELAPNVYSHAGNKISYVVIISVQNEQVLFFIFHLDLL